MEQSPIDNQESDENTAEDSRRPIDSDATSDDVTRSQSSSSDDVTGGGRSVVMRRKLRDDDLDPVEFPSPEFTVKEPYEVHIEIEPCVEQEIPDLPHPRLQEDSRSCAFMEILRAISELEEVGERPTSRLFDEGHGCHSAIESLKYFLGRLKI